MAKMDFSGIAKMFEKVMKTIDDVADGKDGKAVLKAMKQDFEQLNEDRQAKFSKAKEHYDTLKELTNASHDLTFAVNETSKQARNLKSAIKTHKKKLEACENKPSKRSMNHIFF